MLTCSFATRGFSFSDGTQCEPCGVAYHPQCFQAGPPFTTRRLKGAGLSLPSIIRDWPNFICESCTVRSVLDRELTQADDWRFLCLERMRYFDMAHAWALGTHSQYQSKLRQIRWFEHHFRVKILEPTILQKPPSGPIITLGWVMLHYSLRQGSSRRTANEQFTLAYNTIRQLRSAASQFTTWDLMVSCPGRTWENDRRTVLIQDCRFTDDISNTLFAKGLGARIGNEPKPSVALLQRHVKYLDRSLDRLYKAATTDAQRREISRAGFANTAFWLGWLRSTELFHEHWYDLKVIEPEDAHTVDLPRNCGAILWNAGPESKGRRDLAADIVMAYHTFGGFSPGRWFHRLRRSMGYGSDWNQQQSHIFVHENGTPWTSEYFRQTYLYPSLLEQRANGDAFLRAFDGTPGNRISDKFWSLHCYRRGARSHVSHSHKGQYRKATKDEVYEHARWLRKRQSEAIDIMYRQWTLRDRIKLTLMCQ